MRRSAIPAYWTHTRPYGSGDGTTSDGLVTETDGSASVSGSQCLRKAGIYTVKLTVTDKDGDSAVASWEYVIVYDPVRLVSLGWFTSPGSNGGSALSGPVPFTFNWVLEQVRQAHRFRAAFSFLGGTWGGRFAVLTDGGEWLGCLLPGNVPDQRQGRLQLLVAACRLNNSRPAEPYSGSDLGHGHWCGDLRHSARSASPDAPPALPLNCAIGLICICK